jgi:hypothetical protein
MNCWDTGIWSEGLAQSQWRVQGITTISRMIVMTLLLCIYFMVANRVSHPPSMLSLTHSASQPFIVYSARKPANQPTNQPASQSIIGYPASKPANHPTSQPASLPLRQSILDGGGLLDGGGDGGGGIGEVAETAGGGGGGGGGGGIGEVGVDEGGFGSGSSGCVGFVKKIVVMVARKFSFLHYYQIRGQTPIEGRRQGRSKRGCQPDGYHGYFKWEGFLTDS